MYQRYNNHSITPGTHRRKNTVAFTMVEVIVALVILSTTLIAVFGVLRACAGATHHARMLTEAVLLAETLLTQAALDENIALQTSSGAEDKYKWQVRIIPTPIESLAAINVSIKWNEQNRLQQYNLISLRYIKPALEGK